ncbi:uncharacterized protein [Musca autumnalis]|uniref:uncharacterized protein n=1 Tax=Musca autumnalis TaxID=221902 RepID=UPI003CFB59FA
MTNSQLNMEAFNYVLEEILPELHDRKKSTSVPNEIKLAATMRILAEGSYQKGAGNDFSVSLAQSSVRARQLHYNPEMSAKVTEVCAALPESSYVDVHDDFSALDIRSTIMQSLVI